MLNYGNHFLVHPHLAIIKGPDSKLLNESTKYNLTEGSIVFLVGEYPRRHHQISITYNDDKHSR